MDVTKCLRPIAAILVLALLPLYRSAARADVLCFPTEDLARKRYDQGSARLVDFETHRKFQFPGLDALPSIRSAMEPAPLFTDSPLFEGHACGAYVVGKGRILKVVAPIKPSSKLKTESSPSLLFVAYGPEGRGPSRKPFLVNSAWLQIWSNEIDTLADLEILFSSLHLDMNTTLGTEAHRSSFFSLLGTAELMGLPQRSPTAPASFDESSFVAAMKRGWFEAPRAHDRQMSVDWAMRFRGYLARHAVAGWAHDPASSIAAPMIQAAARAAKYPHAYEPGFREQARGAVHLMLAGGLAAPHLAKESQQDIAERLSAISRSTVLALAGAVGELSEIAPRRHPAHDPTISAEARAAMMQHLPPYDEWRRQSHLSLNGNDLTLAIDALDLSRAATSIVAEGPPVPYFSSDSSEPLFRRLADLADGSVEEADAELKSLARRALHRLIGSSAADQDPLYESDREDYRRLAHDLPLLIDPKAGTRLERVAIAIELLEPVGWAPFDAAQKRVDLLIRSANGWLREEEAHERRLGLQAVRVLKRMSRASGAASPLSAAAAERLRQYIAGEIARERENETPVGKAW